MIRTIVTDDDILSQNCENATIDDMSVVEDLIDTFNSLEEAACLAANQIGETKRIAVYVDLKDNRHVMFNPVLKQALHPQTVIEECLSRKGDPAAAKRFDWINVTYQEPIDGKLIDRKRKFQGWEAQVVQHIIDHCNGKLV